MGTAARLDGVWRLFRTTGFRQAVLGAVLAALAAAVVFAVIYLGTLGSMRQTLDEEIRNEVVEVIDPGPVPATAAVLAPVREAMGEVPRGTYFALIDPHGAVLATNMLRPPRTVGWQWVRKAVDTPTARHSFTMRGVGIRLLDGGVLFVGENATTLALLNRLIVRAFAIGFGIMLLIGLLTGGIVGRRTVSRVESLNATMTRIMAGDLGRRIPLSGRADELDELASGVNRMLDKIQALMNDLRQVGNEIAHDLRSPLARLREGLELALVGGHDANLRPALSAAIGQTDEILATFSALLRLARIESGARRADFTPVDLTFLLSDLIETYKVVAEEAGCQLSATLASALSLRGDAALLKQMIANLIENAIRHCPPRTQIALSAKRSGRAIAIVIKDDGPGIAVERRSEALRRFGRIDAARSTAGIGLGLPLAAAIAELHGGRLALADGRPGLAVEIDLLG